MTAQDELKRLTCMFCEFFYFIAADWGYGEYTPGSDMHMGCDIDHWKLDLYHDYDGSFRRKLLSAETCEDFSAREELS